jgi:hypothetical protein
VLIFALTIVDIYTGWWASTQWYNWVDLRGTKRLEKKKGRVKRRKGPPE